MKNQNKNNYKLIYILNYISSACLFIVSAINFFSGDTTGGLIYMGLGSTFLGIGTVWLGKDKENKDKEQ